MAGGSLGLTSNNAGFDLTNVKPQVTFFRKVFKRHTNFGIESIQQTDISGNVNFGNTITITIDNTGSLVSDMHLEFTLPPAAGLNGIDLNGDSVAPRGDANGVVSHFKEYASWVNAVGYAIIDSIELFIDSNLVDKHTGLWYDIWNELTDPNRKEWPLIGKRLESDSNPGIVDTNTTYYLPLQFFFNRNPGLALPIFVIGENKIRIRIKFNPLINLLNFNVKDVANTTTVNTNATINDFKFFTTYIYLEDEEESRIKKTLPAEYLIETLTIDGPITNTTDITNILYENPTKEFIWVFRNNNRIAAPTLNGANIVANTEPTYNKPNTNQVKPNDIFNYSNTSLNTQLNIGTFDTFSSLTLKIRNQNRFDDTDSTFFRNMQPYKHHSNIPGGIERAAKKQFIYVYSFALNPEEYQPSGSYNFGRLNDRTTFDFSGADFDNFTLELFAVKYVYLTIKKTSVTLSNVPTQTFVESGKTDIKGAKEEIKKRYAVEIPHLHVHEHAHIHKKKWSGLQGETFKKEKDNLLNKK